MRLMDKGCSPLEMTNIKTKIRPAGAGFSLTDPVRKDFSNGAGFTLLEVMIALAIIAIALVVILHSHSLSIARTNQAKNIILSCLLAQKQMADIESLEFSALVNSKGGFEGYPQFSWQRSIYETPKEDFKKVALLISWDEGEGQASTEIVTFITRMR